MANPEHNPMKNIVQVDETEMPFRPRHDPVDRPKGGRRPVGTVANVRRNRAA